MDKQTKIDNLRGFEKLLEKQTGRAIRPYHADGYVNLINKYGTKQDVSEHYQYREEPPVPDDLLTAFYESNGLFAKIIDTPAEEAVKHGFELDVKDEQIEDFYQSALEELEWDETCMTAIKWARLFGGSIVVMLINDGRGIDEPLDWKHIKSIDDLRVYDRSLVQEDTTSMFHYMDQDPFGTRSSRLGLPEYYDVYSMYGNFRVHESRVLEFQNGILPENTTNSVYQLWGIPEYIRINKAIRDAEVAHGSATKLLDRSVQAVYKMRGLSQELATEEGEDRVLRRLETIDMARSMLNSITIDAEGEDYDFRSFAYSGVADVIDSTCNWLSALTCIPQTILFGRSPAGMDATGQSDLENWYNYLQRIQNRMIRKNLRYLLSVIFQAGVACGEIDEVPDFKITFNPLWSLSEAEQANIEQTKAATQQTRAQTASIYMEAQVIDPSEVRKKLADSNDFDIETMLDEYDEEELFENAPKQEEQDPMAAMMGGGMTQGGMPQGAPREPADYAQEADVEEHNTDPGTEGDAPTAAPAATKLPEDMSPDEKKKAEEGEEERDEENDDDGEDRDGYPFVSRLNADADDVDWITMENGVHVPVKNGTFEAGPLKGENYTGSKSSTTARSIKDFKPKNSYEDSKEFKKLQAEAKEAKKKEDELYDKRKALEKEIEPERTPKPKDEWDDEDELNALMGGKPYTYTEKGEELKKELDAVKNDYYKADQDYWDKQYKVEDAETAAHYEQIKDYSTTEPKEATKDDYEGFKLNDTGTSFGNDMLKSKDSYIAEMSPKEYLERCAYEIYPESTMEKAIRGIDTSSSKDYADQMKNGEKFDLPYLNYKDYGQEGRHRAYAAYLNGYETIPVLVIGYDKDKVASDKGLRKDSMDSRADADSDDIDWITVNGTHTPLQEGTAIGGGKLSGRDFSQAKSIKYEKKNTGGTTGSSSKRTPVDGKDLSEKYSEPRSAMSIIKEQGFDGLPQILNDEEFDDLVLETNYIAQRVYTATDQDILDSYQDALYNGEFYVEGTGGNAYGIGMYVASTDDVTINSEIASEMFWYEHKNMSNLKEQVQQEAIKELTPDEVRKTDVAKDAKVTKKEADAYLAYMKADGHMDKLTIEQGQTVNKMSQGDLSKWNACNTGAHQLTADSISAHEYPSITETLTLDKSAKVANYGDIYQESFDHGYYDVSAYAALKGYDALKVPQSGKGMDYTVIMNRTKCVFKNSAMATDAADDGPITFEVSGDIIKALRDGKVIGYVFTEGSEGEENNDGGPGSGNHGHAGIPEHRGGSAPGNGTREVVNGKDIRDSYKGSTDIKSVLKAQGFDGLPKVVSKEDFQKAVDETNFIAQRTYSASSEEILEQYQNALYNGDFYVECSGGDMYGKGLYTASTEGTEPTSVMEAEMERYQTLSSGDINRENIRELGETCDPSDLLAMPDAQGCTEKDVKTFQELKKYNDDYFELPEESKTDANKLYDSGKYDSLNKAVEQLYNDTKKPESYPSIVENITLDPSAKVVDIGDINPEYMHGVAEGKFDFDTMDVGTYAALAGYDAIRCPNKGGNYEIGKCDYTVILNRTKMIIQDSSINSDADDGKYTITFQNDEDGNIWAIRNKKVIGWVRAIEPIKGTNDDGGPGSGNFNHAGRPEQRGGSAPGNGSRTPVDGKDLTDSYNGPYETKDIMKAQGFDGLPRVVGRDEFEDLVERNEFLAQRTYSATSQEILDQYHNDLLNGDFYISGPNKSAYGQGMYAAANYEGDYTMGAEMDYYQTENEGDLFWEAKCEYIAGMSTDELRNDPSVKEYDITKEEADVFQKLNSTTTPTLLKLTDEERKTEYSMMDKGSWQALTRFTDDITDAYLAQNPIPSKVESFTMDASANIITYNELNDMWSQEYNSEKYGGYIDKGAYAALKGYDAIRVEQQWSKFDYTVVLNRTKCIFLDDSLNDDSKTEYSIKFQMDDDGVIWAIRDKKVIGYVIDSAMSGKKKKNNNDGRIRRLKKGSKELRKAFEYMNR